MPRQVRSFHEKRALKENIEVHRQRREWALLDEYRRAAREQKAELDAAEAELQREQRRHDPIR